MSIGFCHCGCGLRTNIAERSYKARGLVKGEHYRFVRGHNHRGRPFKTERWAVEDRGYETPCWIWLLAKNRKGYGIVQRGGVSTVAHRVVYEQLSGKSVPPNMTIDHLCRVRDCVNPSHMEIVTALENTRRGVEFRRARRQA